MTTTSFRMGRYGIASLYTIASLLVITVISMIGLSSCKKNDDFHHNQSSRHSAEVLDKSVTMQIPLMKNATGIQNQAFSRHFVYAGIAALEALAPDHSSY